MPSDYREAMLSVDPGVNALGLALWRWSAKRRKKLEPPVRAWVDQLPSSVLKNEPDWHVKMTRMLDIVHQSIIKNCLQDRLRITALFIEWPEIRSGSVGHAAAVRGDVSALAYCCGAMCEMAVERAMCEMLMEPFRVRSKLLAVSEWKGQLPKEVVNKRITRAIGGKDRSGNRFSTHAWDAVGIGLIGKGFALDDPKHFGRTR